MALSRSEVMRRIRAKDTQPELLIRRILTSLGYRYRLHRADLPGKPDIAFISRRKVIFVHGCFWHGHDCKRGARVPKANREYWVAKVARNKLRDKENQRKLAEMGWRSLSIFECQLKDAAELSARLTAFLSEA